MIALEQPRHEKLFEVGQAMACSGQRHVAALGRGRQAARFGAKNHQPHGHEIDAGKVDAPPGACDDNGPPHGFQLIERSATSASCGLVDAATRLGPKGCRTSGLTCNTKALLMKLTEA